MAFSTDCDNIKIGVDQLVRDGSFADEFVCQICQVHVAGCGPRLTKCSHLFCGDCLQQWFAQHPANQTWAQRAKSGGKVPCPVCKTMLHKEDDVYPVEKDGDGSSAMLWQMIQALKIKCDGRQCESGCCHWVGEIGDFGEHLRSGTCGAPALSIEIGIPVASQDDDNLIVHTSSLNKILPPSPSTCSLCSLGPSSADESSLECGSKAPEVEAGELIGLTDSSTPIARETFGEHVPFLIQPQADIHVKEYEHGAADHSSSCPGDLTSESVDMPLSAPSSDSANQQEQKPCPVECPSSTTTSALKKTKSKSKKGSSDADMQKAKIRQDMSAAAVAHHWQAYQWQAAQCQMAYARQYQMAVYGARMQQAMHFQQQFAGHMW